MPMSNGTYYAPTWNNNAPPAIDATELQAISDTAAIVPTLVRPNILDNWYFVGGGSQQGGGQFPINQRGSTTYSTSNGYGIDRWRAYFTQGSLTVQSDGIQLTGTTGNIYMWQPLDYALLSGKKVTASILHPGGLAVGTGTVPTTIPSGETVVINLSSQVGSVNNTGLMFSANGELRFNLCAYMNVTKQYFAVKLEIGDTQTLAHYDSANSVWVLNEVPNYDEQLFRCQTSAADSTDTYANQPNLVGFQVRPNLLDNWYFVGGGSQAGDGHLPINQRGLTSYSVNGYTIDRWRTNFSNDTVTVESNGVKCLNASTSVGWHLHQIISDMDELIGATVTASFFVVGVQGTHLKPIISFRNSSDTEISSINLASNLTTGVASLTGVVPANTSKIRVGFYASSGIASGEYIQASAVKFEVGGTQTLAHYDSANSKWVLNEVPNYQEQLFRCQTSVADSSDTYSAQTNFVGLFKTSDTTPVLNGAINWTYS